jgi:hypothetical protein
MQHCIRAVSAGRYRLNRAWWLCVALVFASVVPVARAQDEGIPRLTHESEQTQLLVDGSPFIILGGQAGNSSASNLQDIESHAPTAVNP